MERRSAGDDHSNDQKQRDGELDPLSPGAARPGWFSFRFDHLSSPGHVLQTGITGVYRQAGRSPRRETIAPKANDTQVILFDSIVEATVLAKAQDHDAAHASESLASVAR